jgi:hypothetical protein
MLVTALGLAAAALLAFAGPAMAKDRNRDRIPDRWERAHHLSLHVNQARRDQDHDGLRNRGEFRAHLNPRDADSDNDGVEDGDENAGKVDSFTAGTLTIKLFGGGALTGLVNDTTEIECGDAHASDDGDDHGDDDDPGEDEDEHGNCDAGALVAGATVKEAELETVGGDAVFEEVKLAP